MTEWSRTHFRDPKVRTMSLCGLGYSWPSTISLTEDPTKVTCGQCREKMQAQ